MSIHSEATLDRKFIEFAKLMNIYLNHFPAHEKYGLSLQIRTAAYDVYALIIESAVSIIGHAKNTHSQRNLILFFNNSF
jgi:hypothetical protein